jgi:prepilin-type N-terminal cleavage/methylation domain-containing protein
MNTNHTKRRAFTLIEIMIVVLIIGILLGIAVPNFVRAREASRAKSCVANLKALEGAYEQYLMTNNLTEGTTPWRSPSDFVPDGLLKTEPKCPSSGTYLQTPLGDPSGYHYRCTTSTSAVPGDPLAHRIN